MLVHRTHFKPPFGTLNFKRLDRKIAEKFPRARKPNGHKRIANMDLGRPCCGEENICFNN